MGHVRGMFHTACAMRHVSYSTPHVSCYCCDTRVNSRHLTGAILASHPRHTRVINLMSSICCHLIGVINLLSYQRHLTGVIRA
jgi:hypothetical protein